MTSRRLLPGLTWEFHGHRCPFMPMGYRMGLAAMRELGVERVKDRGVFALVEIGVGHPQTCMADGVMSATGYTYGKLMMERLGYGKMAAILHTPGKGPCVSTSSRISRTSSAERSSSRTGNAESSPPMSQKT